MEHKLTRREFVRQTAIGASAAALTSAGVARAYPGSEKVRLGWIGMGGRGQELIQDVVKSFSAEVQNVAVCDLIEEKIAQGQKVAAADKPKGYTDMRRMIEQEKLDAVIVATQPAAHAEVSMPAMQAGIHCFQEKPLEITVEKVDALTRVARKARTIFQIGTQRRYNPGFVSAMPLLLKGEFGRVTFMQGHWHWYWPLMNYSVSRTGGMFLDQSCHHFDVMCWAMAEKPPTTCVAMGYHQGHPPEGPRAVSPTQSSACYQFAGGPLFSYTHLFCVPKKMTNEKLWVFCERGCLDLVHGMFYDLDATEERVGADSGDDWGKGTTEQLKDFFDNIRTGGKRVPKANIETARNATLTGIMGRMAMTNEAKNTYEPRVIQWSDLGSTTDPETRPA
jgi:predicted dehydrogenase